MAHYQHILIAADFSEHQDQVTARACSLAEQSQAKLSICHIVEDFPISDFAYDPMISVDLEMRDTLLQAAKDHLHKTVQSLPYPVDNQWVEFGVPDSDIVRLAEENQVDLIVVGSHGRHGIKLLLGSTANAVLHHAKCDVLAVRLPDQ